MHKKNLFVKYIKHLNVIEEAISTQSYRDQQIGKLIGRRIVFVKNFFNKLLDFYEAFPTKSEYQSGMHNNPYLEPEEVHHRSDRDKIKVKDIYHTQKQFSIKEKYKNYQDFKNDLKHMNKDDFQKIENYLKNNLKQMMPDKNFDDQDIFEKEAINKINNDFYKEDKPYDNENIDFEKRGYVLVNKNHLETVYNFLEKNVNIGNMNYLMPGKTDFEHQDMMKKINEGKITENDYQLLALGFYQSMRNDAVVSRLVYVRGKNRNLWLVSPVKDAIYDTNMLETVKKKTDVKDKLAKAIDIGVKKAKEDTELAPGSSYFADRHASLLLKREMLKKSNFLRSMSIKESLKHTVELFKKIRNGITKKLEPNANLSWRKIILDYNNLLHSELNNEVIINKKYIFYFLDDLGFKVNEINFDMGYVTPPEDAGFDDNLISFKELIVYLKVKMNEIKPKDESKLRKMMEELNFDYNFYYRNLKGLKKEVDDRLHLSTSILNSYKEDDLQKEFNDQTILKMDNKDLLEWAKKNNKIKEMQTVIKRYDRNKYVQLSNLLKTFLNRDRADYEKAINILSNPKVISSGSSKMKIIFTLSPRAFISQSTRANLRNNIKSCMNIFFGLHRRNVPVSLAGGAFVVYLVKVEPDAKNNGQDVIDSKIIDPLARILVKPFYDKNDNVYWLADKPYSAGSINETEFQEKVKTILNKYHNSQLPEGEYEIGDHYEDTISKFDLDRIFKIVNDEEMFNGFQEKLKENDEEAINDFETLNTRFKDNIFKIWEKDEFYPTPQRDFNIYYDIRKLPNNIDCKNLTITTNTIAKLPDDLICKRLEISNAVDKKSVNSLNNLKNIDQFESIDVRNSNLTAIGKNILQNEKLKFLTISDNPIDLDKIKEINLPRAELSINSRLKDLPETIKSDSLTLFDCKLDKIKKIETNIFNFFMTIEKEEDIEVLLKIIKNLNVSKLKINLNVELKNCKIDKIDFSGVKNELEIKNFDNIETIIVFPKTLRKLKLFNIGFKTKLDFSQVEEINQMEFVNVIEEIVFPNNENFYKKLYLFYFKDVYIEFTKLFLECKAFYKQYNDNFLIFSNFFYIENNRKRTLTQKYVDDLVKESGLIFHKNFILSNDIDKKVLEEIFNNEKCYVKHLSINLKPNDPIMSLLKGKHIYVTNDGNITFSISENIKYNFEIKFIDEPDRSDMAKQIVANVEEEVTQVDFTDIIKSNKSVITVNVKDKSVFGKSNLKIISKTFYNLKNTDTNYGRYVHYNDNVIPYSIKNLDKNNKINLVNYHDTPLYLKINMEDFDKKVRLQDYFDFNNFYGKSELQINLFLSELYYDFFVKYFNMKEYLKYYSTTMIDKKELEERNEKFKKMVLDKLNDFVFNFVDLKEIEDKYLIKKIRILFPDILYSEEGFGKIMKEKDYDKIVFIVDEIIKKYELNRFIVKNIYEKISKNIGLKYVQEDRPTIKRNNQNDRLI